MQMWACASDIRIYFIPTILDHKFAIVNYINQCILYVQISTFSGEVFMNLRI